MRVKRFATAFVCVTAAAGSILGGAASADPSNSGTVRYFFEQCSDQHPDFYADKQPGGAAALHVINGGGTFVVLKGVVDVDQTVDGVFYAAETVLYDTPGFSNGTNGLPTITCLNESATSHITAWTTGYFPSTTK